MLTIKNITCFAKIKHAFYTGLSIGKDLFFKSSYGIVQVIANIKDVQMGRGLCNINYIKSQA